MNNILFNAHLVLIGLSLLVYLIHGGMMLANKPSTFLTSLAAITSLAVFSTGVTMVFLSKEISFANSWVIAMLIGFLLYVTFGVIGLKSGLKKPIAITLWLLGLAAFVFTFMLAVNIEFAKQLLGIAT